MSSIDSSAKHIDSEKTKTWKEYRNKVLIIVFSILLVAFIAIDISPFGGGNIELYAKWIECGHKPYKGMSTNPFSANGTSYYSKDYIPIRFILSNLEVTRRSFCTEKEAELAGYSADSNKTVFPHLTKEEEAVMWNRLHGGR